MQLRLKGWKKQTELTEAWLRGEIEIPEIDDKWADGPVVQLDLEAPKEVRRGESIDLRVTMSSNKVGHGFPTGPLDMIQSWVRVEVTDSDGREIFSSGERDENHFIDPGSFLFKAEAVDQAGNLIDRHNLWDMVGVRFKRALFPGYSDTATYTIECPGQPSGTARHSTKHGRSRTRTIGIPTDRGSDRYEIKVSLLYRKIDQFLLNDLFGTEEEVTAPVTVMNRAKTSVRIIGRNEAD